MMSGLPTLIVTRRPAVMIQVEEFQEENQSNKRRGILACAEAANFDCFFPSLPAAQ
jgi:hypothetical protein